MPTSFPSRPFNPPPNCNSSLVHRCRNPMHEVLLQERTCTCTAHVPRGRTRQPAAGAPADTVHNLK